MEMTICFSSSIVILHQQDVDASKHLLVTTVDTVFSCLTPNTETEGEMQTSIQTYHLQGSLQTSLNV
jgi:hypothetical protein